jgi:hypothetical protein
LAPQDLAIWYASASVLGGVFAFLTVTIFRRLTPTGTTRAYWKGVGKAIHGLLYDEEDRFWSHYGSIIRQTAIYVGQQLLGVVLAFAPLVVAFYLFSPWIFAQWDRNASMTVIPQHAGALTIIMSESDPDGIDQRTLTLQNGTPISLPPKSGSVVLCPPRHFACVLLQGFGFTALTVESLQAADLDLVIVRSEHGDWNPLWPYLSDPEFLFFLSLILGSIFLFTRKEKTIAPTSSEYGISLIDYVLTLLATRNMRLINKLGDWETKIYANRIAKFSIIKPVFIAGLARSGTTILLEKIASVNGVATHQYRDFPFIMTPIVWNRFLRFFGTEQTPSERPHKDKIKITRDSPDAFEEPIWQYFFPFLHEASQQHILDSRTKNDDFIRFYRQHIQKILLVRNGSRYLSKGNYNLPRVEYISTIFPDAAFLIPIRHPLTHIESLVRQHKLFTQYAYKDPKVPDYLRAVGHYEFGPQRLPICLTDRGTEEIDAAWAGGDDLLGYAIQWRDVYEFVADMFNRNTELRKRLRIVRFEDLCANPRMEFQGILKFINLGLDVSIDQLANGIEASAHCCNMSPGNRDLCWQIVERTASMYGYSKKPREIANFSGFPKRH